MSYSTFQAVMFTLCTNTSRSNTRFVYHWLLVGRSTAFYFQRLHEYCKKKKKKKKKKNNQVSWISLRCFVCLF